MPIRRYDVYGFRALTLEEAAEFIESRLGVPMKLRDSSYRGLYYVGGERWGFPYLLVVNDEDARWHPEYSEYGVTLTVSDQPDMDAICEKLTAGRTDPVLLRTDMQDEPPDDDSRDDDSPDEDGDTSST